MPSRVAVGLLLLILTVPARGQTPANQPTFGTGTTAIVVDVVVRDRTGNPVVDLRKEDFELLEDGVRQEIADLTLVAPARAASGRAASSTAPGTSEDAASSRPATSVETPTFVALVFDRLTPEGRALAHQAARSYVQTARPGDFAGVFLSDVSLVTVQPFTNDPAALRHAIDGVATRATSTFNRLRIGDHSRGEDDPGTPTTASAESSGPAAAMGSAPDPAQTRTVDPASRGEMSLLAMMRRMERTFELLERDQQGVTTVNSLMAVVEGLGQLPGRKTVIFFAEALTIPAHVQARFDSVVATANRLNVSVYSIDAAGLRVHSGQSETARRINSLGAGALNRDPEGGGKLTEQLEINEDTLRRDPAVSLRLLAERTGGFLINNTNDLARGLRDIGADGRFHYLLTYTPKNENFDGGWRIVTVKVPNRRVEVRARSGYQALHTSSAIPLLAWEASALALLDRPSPPRDIPIRVGVLTFPTAGNESRVPILVSVPADRVAFEVTDAAFRTDFTIVARVLDGAGEVLRKGSQPYRLSGPRDQVEAARSGEVLFYRQPSLEPGTYTLEVAVLDTFARQGTVERQTFTVPPATPLGVSSLVVASRGERVAAAELDLENPLYVGDAIVYPNLGEPISKKDGAITLYLTVVPVAGGRPSAELELLRRSEVLATVPLDMDAPVGGRIQQLWRVPVDTVEPGDYTFRAVVTDGARRQVREASVRVVE